MRNVKKFLVGSSAYSCVPYTNKVLNKFEHYTLKVFEKLKSLIDNGESLEDHIGGIIKTSFKS